MNLAEARRRRTRRTGKSAVRADDYFSFEGGLNLVDTPLKVRPGELLGCKNYEPGIRGGYARVEGYERFDGRTKPSAASFTYMDLTSVVPGNYPAVGATVTGDSSGATGRVLVDVTATPGIALGRVTGTFIASENLSSGSVFGAVLDSPFVDLAPDDTQLQTYEKAAADDLRTLITVVPGEGSILGVVPFDGVTYAWRNKTGGATAGMYKSSAAGWVEVVPNEVIAFDTGTGTQPSEGDTVTQLVSGATATIERTVITNGTAWASAVGYFVLSGITGTFDATNALQVSAATVATSTSLAAAPTLAPDGRYEFRIHNFYGHTKSRRLYGVDGQNKGFEYDPTGIYTQITTGMTEDKPTHLAVHQDALWLSFSGGSTQLSADAAPLSWAVVLGAGEIGVGAEITGFLEEIGETLFIMTEKRSYTITGRRGTYAKDDYNFETGTKPWTVQRIGQGIYLDQRAFSTLNATNKYGNFAYNAFSDKVQPLVNALRDLAISSCVSRRKNLYRCFFSDGRFISIGVRGSKITGITVGDYGMPVRCVESLQEGPSGAEMIMFGSDDGYVYEADIGKSFDGELIEAFARIAFHYSRQPTRRKRYRQAAIDITTAGAASLKVSVDYTFGAADEPGNPSKDVSALGGGGFWDISNWDEFQWSTGVVSTARFKLEGAGRNIGLLFYHSSDVEGSHSIEGLTLHYSRRRIDRSTNA